VRKDWSDEQHLNVIEDGTVLIKFVGSKNAGSDRVQIHPLESDARAEGDVEV
jgi:hypothetical protein